VNVCPSLEPDTQSPELMQPRVRSLDHPTVDPQSASVRLSASCDHRLDASELAGDPVRARVVGTIGEQAVRASTRMADLPGDLRDRIDERHELCDVMDVGAGQADGQRDPASIDEDVVLAFGTASIHWTWPAFFPPRPQRGSSTSRLRRATSRGARQLGASRATGDAASPRLRLLATLAGAASRSLRCHTPSPLAGTPKGSPSSGRRECPSGIAGRRYACDPANDGGADAEEAAARSGVKDGRRESVPARRPPEWCWGSTLSIGSRPDGDSFILRGALKLD
jgi:hypothetical protein